MNKSESIANLAAALSAVQGALRPAEENATNPFFKSKYADLASIISAARAYMAANGLSVSQFPGPTYNGDSHHYATLTTILMHSSGEWISQDLTMPLAKVDPQGYGSAITYARRYALASVLGIVAGEDDDANAATQPAKAATRRPLTPELEKEYAHGLGAEVRMSTAKPLAVPSAVIKPAPVHNTQRQPQPGRLATFAETSTKPATIYPKLDGNVEDPRAWLKERVLNDTVNFGFVADAAVMTGHYNDREHVRNALSGYEIAPGTKLDNPDFRIKVTAAGGFKVFDWLMERKQEAQDAG